MIGTHINYYDNSQIDEIEEVEVRNNAPVIMACFGADKGTEEMFDLAGNNFIKMFGDPNYKKYGQVSIQTRRYVDNGARVIGKRVVAEDAKLAHTIVFANMYVTREHILDEEGKKKYITADGTIVSYDEEENQEEIKAAIPYLKSTVNLSYSTGTVDDGVTSVEKIKAAMEKPEEGWTKTKIIDIETSTEEDTKYLKTIDPEGNEVDIEVVNYPLFAIFDCGRGNSSKRFRLVPEYKLSKNLSFMYYTLTGLEGGNEIDTVTFAMVPDTIVNKACIDMNSVSNADLRYIKAYQNEDAFFDFVSDMADMADISVEDLVANDPIFGCNRKGNAYEGIVLSEDSIDLQSITGQDLKEGSNGSWGDSPASDMAQRDVYYKAIEDFYKGKYTEDIYDIDSYQIDIISDAAFPKPVKKAIAELIDYRKDALFIRDYSVPCADTVGITSPETIEDIKVIREDEIYFPHQLNVTDYIGAWEVIDIYSKKQVAVSGLYSIVPLIMDKLKNNISAPLAGQRNGAVIDEIIKGTLNYKPRVTPSVNEKDDLEDLRTNFGSYYRDQYVLETLYTSQDEYTQLSFSNNVLAMQRVIKALRTFFPAVRYAVITSDDDIAQITSQVNSMLENYSSMFKELKFSYIGDGKYVANKIYRAKLTYRFNDFFQAEIIDAYALPSNT